MIRTELLIVVVIVSVIFVAAYFEWPPIRIAMDWKAAVNTRTVQAISLSNYEVIDHTGDDEPFITVDFVKGKHFWHPQLAVWLEDSTGNYLQTLVVTTSTAQGLFYSGRSAENFREFDGAKNSEGTPTRRVDALPVWSHKRGVKQEDGFYSPSPDQPLPDGITMATPVGNFFLKARGDAANLAAFRVVVEINVAFDENEFYSEYDFANDSLYHGGTGLLGQPSIVYSALVRKTDDTNYYVLTKMGRGHHSGGDGNIETDLNTLTTAHAIVERVVVGIDKYWYKKD
jgi:hypothetical protein